jgi:hypothetical protein
MFLRICFGCTLGCSILLLAGCGKGEPQEKPPAKNVETITLHVPEMKARGGYEGAELT